MRRNKKAGLLFIGGLAISTSLTIGITAAGANHGGPHCDELPVDITPDHPSWDPALDADNDGIACESGGGDSTSPEPVAEVPAEEAPEPEPAQPVERQPSFTG